MQHFARDEMVSPAALVISSAAAVCRISLLSGHQDTNKIIFQNCHTSTSLFTIAHLRALLSCCTLAVNSHWHEPSLAAETQIILQVLITNARFRVAAQFDGCQPESCSRTPAACLVLGWSDPRLCANILCTSSNNDRACARSPSC